MSAHSPVEFAERGRETARVEAFSDGVFAIAVTLLVLNLKVPTQADAGGNHSGLGETLLNQWPVYAAYIFSFITILLMWIAHHNFFNYLTGMDTIVMLTNGFQLMGITVVPFTTALLSQWATNPHESGLVAAIYSGTLCLYNMDCILAIHICGKPQRAAASGYAPRVGECHPASQPDRPVLLHARLFAWYIRQRVGVPDSVRVIASLLRSSNSLSRQALVRRVMLVRNEK